MVLRMGVVVVVVVEVAEIEEEVAILKGETLQQHMLGAASDE